MHFDFTAPFKYWDALLIGLWMSVRLTLICLVLGVALGFLTSQARQSRFVPLKSIAILYVELFRGTPVLIQLFWIFYCLPLVLGFEPGNFISAIISLTLYAGAITSETFRSALKSIPSEQYDACRALGITGIRRAIWVVLPQALLRAIPTLLSNAVALFKESALVSAVGMADLMFIGSSISNRTGRPVEMLTAIAIIYFVVAFPITRVVGRIEARILKRLAV
ncbi:amino acid ABC transporter permease [Celeribacter halophilus]|uniref:amino acid ABC transporter permease n=1 Tax=Celeribacter halophilus TaxID=576117 RepID=UPI003A92296B